jgi:3-oxoacyl-[acyl-carrier protein] reductase
VKQTLMPNLSGKAALVAGASRGIGRASALALAASGAQVLVHYCRGADEGNSVHAFIDRIAQGGRRQPTPDQRIIQIKWRQSNG